MLTEGCAVNEVFPIVALSLTLPHDCRIPTASLFAGEIDGQAVAGTVKIEEISESSLDDFDVGPSNASARLKRLAV